MPSAPARRATNLSLDAGLVARARRHTPNLSETVNGLLAEFVAAREAEARAKDARIAASIAASNAFIEAYGDFAEEFRSF
jgi:antitoxin CcdA